MWMSGAMGRASRASARWRAALLDVTFLVFFENKNVRDREVCYCGVAGG